MYEIMYERLSMEYHNSRNYFDFNFFKYSIFHRMPFAKGKPCKRGPNFLQ